MAVTLVLSETHVRVTVHGVQDEVDTACTQIQELMAGILRRWLPLCGIVVTEQELQAVEGELRVAGSSQGKRVTTVRLAAAATSKEVANDKKLSLIHI